MANQTTSSPNQPANEVKKTVPFEDIENSVTFTIELRPGQNRLVVRVHTEFLFSV